MNTKLEKKEVLLGLVLIGMIAHQVYLHKEFLEFKTDTELVVNHIIAFLRSMFQQ